MTKLDTLRPKLAKLLRASIERCFESLSEDLESWIEYPADSTHGDYALPCFRMSKALRKGPPQIASAIAADLEANPDPLVSAINPAGGFLNIKINPNIYAKELIPAIHSGAYFKHEDSDLPGKDLKVMVEFSQPNTHKEFHVGHGRNVCLGDAICRMYRYFSFETMAVNYIGDEGTHIAKCLYGVKQSNEEMPSTGQAEWLGKRYVETNLALDEASDEEKTEIQNAMSEILANLESQSGPDFDLWQQTREACLEDFGRIYGLLDVKFDHIFYESEVSEASQKIVDEYLEKDLFKVDQGAVGIDLSDDKLGFMMVRKSDGNGLYITKDIALAKQKFEEYNVDRNIYVVGSEQEFHFKQLFKFLEKAQFEHADKCYHLSYGMVRRADGKMSSRKGNSFTFMELTQLISDKIDEHMEKYIGEWSEDEIAQTRQQISAGAIKYGMLASDPKKDVVFEPEEWTKFDGNSGPYLMYTFSRARSILRKAAAAGMTPAEENFEFDHDLEGRLLVEMGKLNAVAFTSLESARPSGLVQYLYGLCRLFNKFYIQVPVLKEQNVEVVRSRLALIDGLARILETGLELVGIQAPQRM